jgi:hypothetical protein
MSVQMKTKMVLAMPNRIIPRPAVFAPPNRNTNPDCEAYAEKKADGIETGI